MVSNTNDISMILGLRIFLADCHSDSLGNFLRRPKATDGLEEMAVLVVGQHRFGLLTVNLKPSSDDVGSIIISATAH